MAGWGRDETEEEVGEQEALLYNAIENGELATVTDIIREHPLLLTLRRTRR